MKVITRNAIRCKHCEEIIESKSVHNFVQCSCGACFVDGGHEYLRRGYLTHPEEDYEDLTTYTEMPSYKVNYYDSYGNYHETEILAHKFDRWLEVYTPSVVIATDKEGHIVYNTFDDGK